MYEEGKKNIKDPWQKVLINVRKSHLDEIKRVAKEDGVSTSQMIRILIREKIRIHRDSVMII